MANVVCIYHIFDLADFFVDFVQKRKEGIYNRVKNTMGNPICIPAISLPAEKKMSE